MLLQKKVQRKLKALVVARSNQWDQMMLRFTRFVNLNLININLEIFITTKFGNYNDFNVILTSALM